MRAPRWPDPAGRPDAGPVHPSAPASPPDPGPPAGRRGARGAPRSPAAAPLPSRKPGPVSPAALGLDHPTAAAAPPRLPGLGHTHAGVHTRTCTRAAERIARPSREAADASFELSGQHGNDPFRSFNSRKDLHISAKDDRPRSKPGARASQLGAGDLSRDSGPGLGLGSGPAWQPRSL